MQMRRMSRHGTRSIVVLVSILFLGLSTTGPAAAHSPHPGPVVDGNCRVQMRTPEVHFKKIGSSTAYRVYAPASWSGCEGKAVNIFVAINEKKGGKYQGWYTNGRTIHTGTGSGDATTRQFFLDCSVTREFATHVNIEATSGHRSDLTKTVVC